MFEVSKVNVNRGVFEWELEGKMPFVVSWVGRLGPIRSRGLALFFIFGALFFTINASFASWVFSTFSMTSSSAMMIQSTVKWILAGTGALVWFAAFLFQKPVARLVMDRPHGVLNLIEQSYWTVAPKKEQAYKFEDVVNIDVFSKDRQPPTPQGFLRLKFKPVGEPPKKKELSFKFLTAEQFQFFPTNLYKIIGTEPKGDWNEDAEVPDDSIPSPKT